LSYEILKCIHGIWVKELSIPIGLNQIRIVLVFSNNAAMALPSILLSIWTRCD